MIQLQSQNYEAYSEDCLPIEKSRLMPGFLLGQEGSLPGIDAAFRSGVSDIEIVLPHYDQKMDGDTIRFATERIFAESISSPPCEMIKNLAEYLKIYRSEYFGYQVSNLHVMSYYHGIFKGRHKSKKIHDFITACVEARVSNLIVPDIPDDPDGDFLKRLATQNNINITRIITIQTRSSEFKEVKLGEIVYTIPKISKTGGKLILDSQTENVLNFFTKKLPNCEKLIGFGVTPEAVPKLQNLGYTPVFCSPIVKLLSEIRNNLTTDDPQTIYNQYYNATRKIINQHANINSN